MKPDLVLCLGNEILADDAFGAHVYDELSADREVSGQAELIFAARAGLNLLDLLAGYHRVLIVDTIVTGRAAPGTIHYFPLDPTAPARHLTGSHQVSLPTALALGQQLGYAMPAEVDVLAVEASDVCTLGGPMTEAVEASLPSVLEHLRQWLAEDRNFAEVTAAIS